MNHEAVVIDLLSEIFDNEEDAIHASEVVGYCFTKMDAPPTFISVISTPEGKYRISTEDE